MADNLTNNLPTHVAIIPDGNRRWAEAHQLISERGHLAGAERMHTVVEELLKHGIKFLTIWGFSTDNWKRSQEEVDTIFQLTEEWIKKETPWLHKNNVKLRYIGHFAQLPQGLKRAIKEALMTTRYNFDGMTLILAFNYSGRAELVHAVRSLIEEGVQANQINEILFGQYLYTSGIPDVDLVIRTADEFRTSNFMLWQTAYSEYYFTKVLWPDFDIVELQKALNTYSERKRRFGGDELCFPESDRQ